MGMYGLSLRARACASRLASIVESSHLQSTFRHGNLPSLATFSTTRKPQAKNHIYTPVRRPEDFRTYLLLSASNRTPLLTLWTTSWCATCRTVSPLLQSIIESGVGEAEGGVGFCAVEYDAPDVMREGLGLTYMITSVPTLLSFDAQEPQTRTKVADAKKLTDREFVEDWIRREAGRHGGRGGGMGSHSPLDGLFGRWK